MRKRGISRLIYLGLAVALMVAAGGFGRSTISSPSEISASDHELSQTLADQNYLNCFDLPEISPNLPGAPSLEQGMMMNQNIMNCFAWQEFIALNWSASTDHAGQHVR